MNLNLFDNIVLLGGIQAFSLCVYLTFRESYNKRAKWFFILFLLCLSMYNLGYAAIFMDIQIGALPSGAQPVPYKYLIAPTLFGYVSYSIQPLNSTSRRIIWLLLFPALLYGLVRMFWVYMILSGENKSIMKEVYDTGFFTINELVYLLFNLILGLVLLKEIRDRLSQSGTSFGTKKNWSWLKTLLTVFVGLTSVHLLLILASLHTLGLHDRIFYYPTLIINSLFVYWIGFIGYSKPNLLFFKPLLKSKPSQPENGQLHDALKKAMEEDKLFKNSKLTSQQLASKLDFPMHEVTRYLNDQLGLNFSQYLNKYRTEEAIKLISTDLSDKYTLEALAKDAGFNSKSSFYKIFKEQTGKTPATFVKTLK